MLVESVIRKHKTKECAAAEPSSAERRDLEVPHDYDTTQNAHAYNKAKHNDKVKFLWSFDCVRTYEPARLKLISSAARRRGRACELTLL